jgi:hypothetical protein
MSLVDYATAARRRPETGVRRVQPGLWLAWAVMIAALMAIAPQLFTAYNPLEGIPGAQRLAPQAATGWAPTSWAATCGRGIVFGAVHSLSAALARSPSAWWSVPRWARWPGAGRTRGVGNHAPGRCPAGHPLCCCR